MKKWTMRHQYVGIGESCNPRPIQTRETQVKGQVFISLKTKQLNSTTSALEFFYIKQLAECGVWIFFFCIVFATTRSKMIWKQLASTKQLWSFKNELHVIIIHDCSVLKVACDHKDQRNWKLCYTPVCSQLEIRSSIKRYSFQSC